MNHIPTPSQQGCAPLEVGYLVKPEHTYYDGGFEEFLSHLGLSLSSGDSPFLCERSTSKELEFEDHYSVVQSWLYFALLKDVCNRLAVPLDLNNFIKSSKNGGERNIDSTMLPNVLLRMSAIFDDWPLKREGEGDRCAGFEFLRRYLTTGIPLINGWEEHQQTFFKRHKLDGVQQSLVKNLWLSINCLFEGLVDVLKLQQVPTLGIFSVQQLLTERLQDAGWCKHIIAKLQRRLHSSVCLYYLSCMSGPEPSKHKQCTPQKCFISNLDENSYQRPHASACDKTRCRDYCVESPKELNLQYRPISSVVRNGKLPLLIYTGNEDGPVVHVEAFEQKPKEERTRFVAISHVWSDGLGNPKENAIHVCQARRLQKVVNDMYPDSDHPVPFWLDSICVPLDPKYQEMALEKMADAYEFADKVLVLDSLLYNAPVNMELGEVLMRIAICTWTTRLWTLQESIYASNLQYLVANKFYDFHGMWRTCVETPTIESVLQHNVETHGEIPEAALRSENMMRMLLNPLYAQGMNVLRRVGYFKDIKAAGDGARLASLNTTLALRSTSISSDEAYCVASILGQDLGTLMTVSEGDRMAFVFKSMAKIPLGLLFDRRPRQTLKGNRWMPKSLLWEGTDASIPLYQKHGFGTYHVRGLLACLPSIRINHAITTPENRPAVIQFQRNDTVWAATMNDETGLKPWQKCSNGRFALVFSEEPGAKGPFPLCILVEIEEEVDSIIFAAWDSHVHVAASNIIRSAEQVLALQQGTHLSSEQTWCIG